MQHMFPGFARDGSIREVRLYFRFSFSGTVIVKKISEKKILTGMANFADGASSMKCNSLAVAGNVHVRR